MKELIMGDHGWKYMRYVLIREWLKENLVRVFAHVRKVNTLTDELFEIENILKNFDINKLDNNAINDMLNLINILKQKAEAIEVKIKQKILDSNHKKIWHISCIQ